MRQRRAALEDEIQRIEWALAHGMPRRMSLDLAGHGTPGASPLSRAESSATPDKAMAVSAAAVAASADVASRLEARAQGGCLLLTATSAACGQCR